jgi:hypothetical protein
LTAPAAPTDKIYKVRHPKKKWSVIVSLTAQLVDDSPQQWLTEEGERRCDDNDHEQIYGGYLDDGTCDRLGHAVSDHSAK